MMHIGVTLSFHDSLTYRGEKKKIEILLWAVSFLNLCLLWTSIATSKVVGEG